MPARLTVAVSRVGSRTEPANLFHWFRLGSSGVITKRLEREVLGLNSHVHLPCGSWIATGGERNLGEGVKR